MKRAVKSDMKAGTKMGVNIPQEIMDDLIFVVDNAFPVVVLTAIIIIIIVIIMTCRHYIRWTVPNPDHNRLQGKTVLITGANTGLGKHTAFDLAKRGARMVLACRDKSKGEAVARTIRKKTGNQYVNSMVLDLGSLTSIREFVKEYDEREKFLHVLINNAGYMGPKATTEDGLERNFGVNYLGHFLLTYLMREKLKKCSPSRIINVVSDSYKKGKIDFDDLAFNKGYDIYAAYARSKLAQLIFNVECHRHFYSHYVMSFAVHPGYVATDLLRNYPGVIGNLLRVASRVLFKSPEDGMQSIIYCAVGDKIKTQSGKLFENCSPMKLPKYVTDKDLGRKLWEVSLHLVGLDMEIPDYDLLHQSIEAVNDAQKKDETPKKDTKQE